MSDTNQLLLLIAAAQQQQQQQAMLAKLQKTDATTASTSSTVSGEAKNGSSGSSGPSGGGLQNVALAQQLTQLAQIGALMAAAQKKPAPTPPKPPKETKEPKTTPPAPSATPGTMTPEMLMMWQQAIQMQALQQMMMTPQKNQMEEAIKKMMEMAKKKPSGGSGGNSGSQTANSGNSGNAGTSSESNSGASGAQNQMMNNVMWQLVAQQMQQKQQQQQKESQKKAEQLKKAKEAAKQQQKEQDAKTKQQEEIVKFLMAQHQLNHQKKHQKKQEETAALAAILSAKAAAAAAASNDPEENGKKLSEAMIRLPLQLGWRRQTCVRMMSANGVRGDVSYFAPCGKKLGTYSEVVRYLAKNGITYINRDNFAFTTKMVIGEFIVPKTNESDELRQEREFAVLTEDDINKELVRLNVLKAIPKSSHAATPSGDEETQKPVELVLQKIPEEPEEPLDPSELNDEFLEDIGIQVTGTTEECKIRERESDDLLVNDNRHLPEFSRIGNQCLSSVGFADALMVHEFVQNFGHVLGIDLETTPKLESLCSGLAGDAEHADSILQLTRKLLRLALEFPGMGNEKRFGQGGGEMGLDRENFSEVMRLFLIDKGKRGEELSLPLLTCNFLSLRGEQKASILAFLCDELVCSRNVVTEIDKNLDEISRLRGEKWMREGKARALKSARAQKKKKENSLAPENHHESDSEPPTRPVTPKKNGVGPAPLTISPPNTNQGQKKFTPGLGQCEVLTEQEESMSQEQMDQLISSLQIEATNINQKIHNTTLRIRSFPFGTDRFHRNYWLLAHTDTVLVESISSSIINNPACNLNEIAAKDPPLLEDRVEANSLENVDLDVISVVEDLVDEVVLLRAKADKKTRKRYRRVENSVKRGWWTVPNRETIESLRTALLGRGIRERALHRLLTKPWFINDLKLGTINLDPVGPSPDLELLEKQGWIRLGKSIDKLQSHLRMSDVAKPGFSLEQKPTVVPTSMTLAQVVKDEGVQWKVLEDFKGPEEQGKLDHQEIRKKIVKTADMVDPKYWRPKFRVPERDLEDLEAPETPINQLFEDWKLYVLHEAQTTSQLMVALQALEGMIMWERSAREALCQICKSMDGDEMLVCDGCESGCHMECFRPRMLKVPEGDWFCQRCREEKSGKSLCMFCSKESGTLYECQRCAYHMHQECAQDDKKETIHPETFICPHCQEMKQMRFVKRVMLRGESEERDDEEETEKKEPVPIANGTPNSKGNMENAPILTSRVNLKRKMEPSSAGGLPLSMNKELCVLMLDELQGQSNAIPFLEPVNPKQVPGYKMIIAKPMDLGTIRTKNGKDLYETPEDFAEDIELMFANCRQFNIDHSEIGRAGINLHKFFQKRWKQLKYNFTKRLRRLHRHS